MPKARIIRPISAPRGFTGPDGFKTEDAPDNWPFGRVHPDPWIKALKDATARAKARRLAKQKEKSK